MILSLKCAMPMEHNMTSKLTVAGRDSRPRRTWLREALIASGHSETEADQLVTAADKGTLIDPDRARRLLILELEQQGFTEVEIAALVGLLPRINLSRLMLAASSAADTLGAADATLWRWRQSSNRGAGDADWPAAIVQRSRDGRERSALYYAADVLTVAAEADEPRQGPYGHTISEDTRLLTRRRQPSV